MTTDARRKHSFTQNSCRESECPKQRPQTHMESSKWRSRSLSELPGHLRVPVLRRKDTERTQARLEAGVAGLAELRLLREQQMALVEQTVAASTKLKQRPPSHRKQIRSPQNPDFEITSNKHEDGRIKQQQTEDQETRLSWQSTASLCSTADDSLTYRERTSGGDSSEIRTLRGGSLCIRSPTQSTWSLGDQWEGYHTEVWGNSQKFQENVQGPRQDMRQHWQDNAYKHKEANMSRLCLEKSPGNQTETHDVFTPTKSMRKYDDSYSRKSGKREPNYICATNAFQRDYTKELHPSRSRPSLDYHERSSKQQESSPAQPYRHNHKRAASVDYTPLDSSQTTNAHKYMSWDNLLMLAGLQAQHFDSEDDQSDVSRSLNFSMGTYRKASLPESTQTESSLTSQDHCFAHMKMKKGRSHSFCCDSGSSLVSKKPVFSNALRYSEAVERMDTENESLSLTPSVQYSSDQDENVFAATRSVPDRDTEKTNAIIRRASIQCETVLTGACNRKIFNPLHEIDVVALKSPGPLHAVTLQYKGMPLNTLPEEADTARITKPVRGRSASVDLCYFSEQTVSNGPNHKETSGWEEKPFTGQRFPKQRANSTKQSIRPNLQPILENGSNTLSSSSPSLQSENNDICPSLQMQSESVKGEHVDKSVPEQQTPHFLDLENGKTTGQCKSNNSIPDLNENSPTNKTDCEESQTPTKVTSPSFTAVYDVHSPLSSQSIIDSRQNPQRHYSSLNTKAVAAETSPCSSPAMTCQLHHTPSSSTSKSEVLDVCPSLPLSPARQHPPDVSLILSDDGYSTCDSLGPHSRLSIGPANSSSSSDWSSLSSGSVSNVSLASAFFPSSGFSANRRTQGSRPPRFSHPLNSSRIDSDLRSKSCSSIRPDGWPSCSMLTHVPEGSNSDIASSTSLCQDEPGRDKEPITDFDADHLSSNKQDQQKSKTEKVCDRHESALDFDSVFSDDIVTPANFHTHSKDCSPKLKDSKQIIRAPSSEQASHYGPSSLPLSAPNSVAVIEEGAIIHLEVNTDTSGSMPPKIFSGSSTEGKETLSKYSKRKLSRIKMIPNKGVKQTAV